MYIMNMNNLRKFLDGKKISPEMFCEQLKTTYPWLGYAEITIKSWYYGYRNPHPDQAFFVSEFFNGEISRDDLIYSPKRLAELRDKLSKAA